MPTAKHMLIFRLLNKKISKFTAVSNHIVKVLERLNIPATKIELIYNGIPIPGIHKLNNNNSVSHIGIIGQVVAWKGHRNLIEAANKLVTHGVYNFKVLIYGNDSTNYGSELKKTIKQKGLESYFEWKGFVKNQADIYANCDIVVVPTLTGEPCSLTIIESMFQEKALIVSDRGGNPELVDNGENGLIFKAENPSDLYTCILKLITEDKYRDTLAFKAKEKATLRFNYLRMTEQYMDVYKINKTKRIE